MTCQSRYSRQHIFHPKIKKKLHEIIFGNIIKPIYMHINNFEMVTLATKKKLSYCIKMQKKTKKKKTFYQYLFSCI